MNNHIASYNQIDALGDAYEYLMSMYASNVGKSGGEFFTPTDLSKLLIDLITAKKDIPDNPYIYDPTCGYYVIIMTVVKSLIKSRVLVLLQNIKTLKNNNLCVV